MGKKLLSTMLALMLTLSMAVCGGAEEARLEDKSAGGVQEALYTLWDIPWGSTQEEVIRLARENGNALAQQTEYDWLCIDNPKIMIRGCSVKEITFFNDDNDRLNDIYISCHKYEKGEVLRCVRDFERAYQEMERRYGPMKDASFLAYIPREEHEIIYDYTQLQMPSLLEDTPNISYGQISEALQECKKMTFAAIWGNMCLAIFKNPWGRMSIYIQIVDHVLESEKLTARRADLPTWKEYKAERLKDNNP